MSLKTLTRFSLLSLLLINTSSWAGLLCAPDCQVEIDFTNGGTIEAVEEVTFIFGDSGLVDTGSTSSAYVKDDTLLLNAGETLDFSSGGVLNLGNLGNIDYTHLVINTGDFVSITSGTAFTRVSILADHTLEYRGDADITIQADEFVLDGSLVIDGSLTLEARSNSTPGGGSSSSSCNLTNTSGSGVSLNSGETYDLTSGSICSQLSQDIQIPDLEFGGGVIQVPSPETPSLGISPIEQDNDENGSTGSFNFIVLGFCLMTLLVKVSTITRQGLC